MAAGGSFTAERGTNLLDTGAHFYDTYETSDGEHICIGSIEPQFYALLVEKSGVDPDRFAKQMDPSQWPAYKAELTEVFKSKTRAEWCAIMEGSDVCFAPVLSIYEAPEHPHNKARETFIEVDGVVQPAPSPRFSRTVPEVSHGPRAPGEDSAAVLEECGFDAEEIAALQNDGVIPKADATII
jgi:alpha-methylacyl-CoA racemase